MARETSCWGSAPLLAMIPVPHCFALGDRVPDGTRAV